MKNKIKTTLFAALLVAMILPFSGMLMAEAAVPSEKSNNKVTEKAKDKVPEDKLVQRNDSWKSQYPSVEKFEKAERSFKAFIDTKHPDNKWNKITKKNHIIIYNFDTLVGQLHAGLNVLLSNIEDQKSTGTYFPTEAERRFHEYAETLVSNPVSYDVDQEHIDKVIAALNENANFGNVPKSLVKSDVNFWIEISTDKTCELLADCNTSSWETIPITSNLPFVQFAEAETYSTLHLLKVTVNANDCYEGSSCYYSHSSSGSGALSSGASSTKHSGGTTIHYTVNDKSFAVGHSVSHHITGGTVSLGSNSYNIGSSSGINSASISGDVTFSITCGSSHCGTFGISAQADSATYVTQ